MQFIWNAARVVLVAAIVVIVADVSKRHPRYGALLLSLPLVSILAFMLSWFQHGDMPAISRMAKETLILVPLGLPFFFPFAFASKLGLGFWTSFTLGVVLAATTIGTWMLLAPVE